MKPCVEPYRKTPEDRAVIDMTVKDDTDFLSRFSKHSTPVISSDVADFLENSTQNIPPKTPLHVRIYSDCIDEDEKPVYAKAMKDYYADKVTAAKRELHRNTTLALALALVGIFILAVSLIMDGILWSEVMDIAAWVFLWEAVDIVAFRQRELRLCRYRYTQFTEMVIEYLPPEQS